MDQHLVSSLFSFLILTLLHAAQGKFFLVAIPLLSST